MSPDSEFIYFGMLLLDGKNEVPRKHKIFMSKYCMFTVFVLVAACIARASDWPHWRGPYFDGSTKTLWRQIRPSEAQGESREAYSTPIPFSFNGNQQLLVAGGDALTGHDLETGKELWRWGTWNPRRITHWRLVPSPVTGDGVVLVCAPKNAPVYAIRPTGTGVQEDSAIVWFGGDMEKQVTSDVPTPAYYDDDFFVLSDLRKHLSRVEPRTGKVKWTIQTPGSAKYEASPLAADGKIYIIDHTGEVAVLDAANGNVLSLIPMDKPSGQEVVRASISTAHGHLFIRTTRRLYCVGK